MIDTKSKKLMLVRFMFRADSAMLARLATIAAEQGCTRTDLVRRILGDYIRSYISENRKR